MKLISYLVPAVMLLFSFFYDTNPLVVKEESQRAYMLLNAIRQHPEQYRDALHLKASLPVTKTTLHWNDTLATIAETKAMDMARRKYFNHVDPDGCGINYYLVKNAYALPASWTAKKDANFFESIAAGTPDAQEAVKAMILDETDPSYGHRNHLLGIGEWNASLTDIGIGFVKCDGGKFQSYTCIIIAKHK